MDNIRRDYEYGPAVQAAFQARVEWVYRRLVCRRLGMAGLEGCCCVMSFVAWGLRSLLNLIVTELFGM